MLRATPIETGAGAIDQAFWKLFASGSRMRQYRLVGTQWVADAAPDDTLPISPPILANTMLETFVQGGSSCVNCHHFATLAGAPTVSADFSYLLGDAQELAYP